MIKAIALVLILLLLIFISYEKYAVNPKEAISSSDMLCNLSSIKTNKCSGTLVLENGVLQIFSNSNFELSGHYNACFNIKDIIIKGKYQYFELDDSFQLELLGKQIQEDSGKIENFPKTIGLVKLNKRTLEGVFIDHWATIRAQNYSREKTPSLKLVCHKL